MRRTVFYVFAAALLGCIPAGCRSQRTTAATETGRQKATEVDEATLQLEGLLIEAKMQQEAGNDKQALELYKKILTQDNRCAAAHYETAAMLLQAGALDSALYHGHRANELETGNVWYKLLLTNIYGHRYDHKAVAAMWEEIVAVQPDRRENYYQLSDAYLQAGDAENAIDALNRAERRWGVSEAVSLQKQKLWEALGKPQQALHEVENLARSMPEETRFSAIVAEAYMKQKDYRHAKPYYDNIARQRPDDEFIHISLANYYKLTGEPQRAMEELATGFRHPKLSCTDKMQILSTFYSTEEFYKTYAPETYALVDTLVRYCEDSSSYAMFYADVLMRRERYEEALPWIRLYLRHDSSRYEAWEALLICESMTQDSNRLAHDAALASELFPFHLLPHYLLALDAHGRHEYTTALTHLERCRKLGFRNGYLEAECYGLMAECHYRAGEPEKAWPCFDRYLELHPDDMGILNNYAYYLSEMPGASPAQLVHAEQMSRRTIEAEPKNATFLDTYAWILHRMGRDHDALPYMRRAVENDPQHSETLLHHYRTILENQ